MHRRPARLSRRAADAGGEYFLERLYISPNNPNIAFFFQDELKKAMDIGIPHVQETRDELNFRVIITQTFPTT
ncbi:hypothetical protein Y032_0464g1935 [Ancylostoma ceylanicum]|uniref:Uncharacterized protein n=1 Tax=Ancylostoma ceylanicum TaxID=53326 RepID=A0A016WYJ9_9BILA|nr:hypothetical protein Y032_0464g1935 [Ancylostoma ceylanicum]